MRILFSRSNLFSSLGYSRLNPRPLRAATVILFLILVLASSVGATVPLSIYPERPVFSEPNMLALMLAAPPAGPEIDTALKLTAAGDNDGAKAALRRLQNRDFDELRLIPNVERSLQLLGALEMDAQEFDLAAATLKLATKLKAADPSIVFMRAIVAWKLGQTEEALARLEEALWFTTDTRAYPYIIRPDIAALQGQIYLDSERGLEIYNLLLPLTVLHPQDLRLQQLVTYSALIGPTPSLAASQARIALAAHPDDPYLKLNLAVALLTMQPISLLPGDRVPALAQEVLQLTEDALKNKQARVSDRLKALAVNIYTNNRLENFEESKELLSRYAKKFGKEGEFQRISAQHNAELAAHMRQQEPLNGVTEPL